MARRTNIERNIYQRPDGRYEIGYRDTSGRQRWQTVRTPGLKAARAERDTILGARGKGARVEPSPRLRFGEAADAWLAGPVAELRPTTASVYRYALAHALDRWRRRRLGAIGPDTCVQLVRELRGEGLSESYIASVLGACHQVFRHARRHLGWQRQSPVADLLKGERPKVGSPERRVYEGDELAQTIAAAAEPWRTLFALAAVTGARESELLGLKWEDLDLEDLDVATVTFGWQVDRRGRRVPLKTAESKATLPLPRQTALMLLEHRARCVNAGRRGFVFATRSGRPLGQRNVLRALYRAQERARHEAALPTFPDLFEHDEHGHLAVDEHGRYVLRRRPRRELPPLPDFHSIRHAAAMDCDDAEEARDLLRHRNSTVTRAVYRAHFSDRRREALRVLMGARAAAAGGAQHEPAAPADAEVIDIGRGGDARAARRRAGHEAI